jgi:hypothetical protein
MILKEKRYLNNKDSSKLHDNFIKEGRKKK